VSHDTLVKASRHEQLVMAATDSVGLCEFSNPVPDDMAKLVSAQHGVDWRAENVLAMARRVLIDERDFNRRAGFGRDADAIPRWLREEPLLTPEGPEVFDIDEALIDGFWDFE
jgi:aldehyde:ferredoxin oxidoreductase